MPEHITSSADLWVAVEGDIPGADSSKTASNSGNASTQPALMVGYYNATLPTLSNGAKGVLALDANGRVLIGGIAQTVGVSGSVTANLSAADNAVLDAIQAATEATQTAVEGTLTTTSQVASLGTFANRSTDTGATQNTWVQVAASNASRTRFFLNLPSTASNSVLIGLGDAASEVAIAQVQPGGSFLIEESALACDTQRISAQSPGTSVAFYAHEYTRR